MDPHLQRLIRELRAERCPPRVLEKVKSRLTTGSGTFDWFRFRAVGFAACLAALLAVLLVWRWPDGDVQSPSQASLPRQTDAVQVAGEAGAALAYIGSVLLEAGKHTENVLLEDAVPPLRSGIEAVSKTLKSKE